ncbi:fructosamine kinase family protein [Glaciihabitans sp. dw_435]|uniref:fructosamine kinase family protein n=1 Tax=Glaciihabitans sp. dw_435 TaxID=2720081 RepID=UPI0027DE86BD|nr:fructosamine kinase family protein [Glaciihabitans sp. dw_435]
MRRSFSKRLPEAPDRFFEAEAAGLEWLSVAGGTRVVRVLSVAPGAIDLERVDEVRPTAGVARRFGASLARTHAAGAAAFGAPPDGWDGPLFIGSRAMAVARDDSWGSFYARDRVLPFLAVAEGVGSIDRAGADVVREACEVVASGFFDDGDAPSRIHGDLWTGNVLWATNGVVLIDPAAHGGHRETDLAMLALFGCPYLTEVIDGYLDASPLRPGWEARVPLHQLHPLAVHAAGHGPSYGHALQEAAREVLDLAGR